MLENLRVIQYNGGIIVHTESMVKLVNKEIKAYKGIREHHCRNVERLATLANEDFMGIVKVNPSHMANILENIDYLETYGYMRLDLSKSQSIVFSKPSL